MDILNLRITLSPTDAAEVIKDGILTSSLSSGLTDEYTIVNKNGVELIALVFEDYYLRCSNCASLSVTIHNIDGYTFVHAVGSGAGVKAFATVGKSSVKPFTRDLKMILNEYIL